MKNLELNKIKHFQNCALYYLNCDKLRKKEVLNLSTLQRVLRLTAKTTLLNNTILTYKLKHSDTRISIIHIKKNAIYVDYFLVKISSNKNLEILISALSLKELMYKINHVYKLIKP